MRFSFALGLVLALTGCGAAKQGSSSGTTNSSSTTGAPPLTGLGATAECNQIPPNDFALKGVLSSFWSGQAFVDSLARLRLTSVPAGVITTDTQYISVLRWQVSGATGIKNYAPSPTEIVFVLRGNNQYLNSNSPVQQISKSIINSMISTYQLGHQGITLENFLSNVLIILNGLAPTDQAFDFNLYDHAVGNSAIATTSALIAPFTADPYAYRASHPSPWLYQLHPNNALPAGLSESQYVAATNVYCQGFL